MKIDRVKVDRGVSVEVAKNVWDKTNYGLEASLDRPGEHEEAKAKLEEILDVWINNVSKHWVSPEEHARAVSQATKKEPQFKVYLGLDEAPWKASNWVRKKDPDRDARVGEDAWTFSDKVNIRELKEKITRDGAALAIILGTKFTLKFSGENNRFISRVVWKEPKEARRY